MSARREMTKFLAMISLPLLCRNTRGLGWLTSVLGSSIRDSLWLPNIVENHTQPFCKDHVFPLWWDISSLGNKPQLEVLVTRYGNYHCVYLVSSIPLATNVFLFVLKFNQGLVGGHLIKTQTPYEKTKISNLSMPSHCFGAMLKVSPWSESWFGTSRRMSSRQYL